MAEDKIAGIMREYVKLMADGDVEKCLTYYTEDAVVTNPYGTFRGKEAIRNTLAAMAKNMKNMKVTETGNGIITQGDKTFFEHIITGTYQGKRFEFLAMCAYEFEGDKIKNVRTVFDRLLIAQQAAPGWFARSMVNIIVKETNKAVQ
jgi:uncharacterized protein (TIGR02246 family)